MTESWHKVFGKGTYSYSTPSPLQFYSNVECFREQTEGEYSAIEHESVKGVVECLKVVTAEKSYRIAKFAFDYATRHGRKKVIQNCLIDIDGC